MAISAEDKNFLVSLYVGYFNRAPDPAGLQFWIDQVEAGRDTNTIAADFAASPEAKSLYPFLTTPDVSSPTSFITAVYANLFNRAPDAAGQAFWEAQLSSGAVSPADAIDAIIKGATTAPDATILANKNVVGLDFATDAGNTPGFTFDLDGASGSAAKDAISGVTEDSATVTAAQAATDAYLSGVASPGQTFTLTENADTFVGTANDDVFNAPVIAAGGAVNQPTLNPLDNIDGGSGTDTLIVETTGNTVVQGTFTNIENLTLLGAGNVNNGGALNVSSFSGEVELQQTNDPLVTLTNVSGQTIIADRMGASTVEVDATATQTSIALESQGAAAAVQFDIDGAKVDSVSLKSDGASGANAITIDNDEAGIATKNSVKNLSVDASAATVVSVDSSALETLTVTGKGLVTLLGDQPSKSVDTTGSEGGATVTLLGNTATFTGGVGKDTMSVGATTKAHNMGGGDDVVGVTSDFGTGGSVDGGDGNDTLSMSSLNAQTLSSNASFEGKFSNFEMLSLLQTAANTTNTVNLANLDDISMVKSAGTAAGTVAGATSETATFDFTGGLKSGQSITITDGTVTQTVTAGTGTLSATAVSDAFVAGFGVDTLDNAYTIVDNGSSITLTATTVGNKDNLAANVTVSAAPIAPGNAVTTAGTADTPATTEKFTLALDAATGIYDASVDTTNDGITIGNGAGAAFTFDAAADVAAAGGVLANALKSAADADADFSAQYTTTVSGTDVVFTSTASGLLADLTLTDVDGELIGETLTKDVDGAALVAGTATVRDITFNAAGLQDGESVTVAGRTVTATGGDLTPDQIAAAFVQGNNGNTVTIGDAVVTGTLAGWTAADSAGGDSKIEITAANAGVNTAVAVSTSAAAASPTPPANIVDGTATGPGGSLNLLNVGTGGTLELTGAINGASSVAVKDAATNAADTFTVALNGAANILNTAALTVASVETINVTTADTNPATDPTAASALNLAATSASAVNVSGNHGVNFTGSTLGAVKTFDASGVTATGAAGATTFSTSSTNLDVTLTGGAGNDVLSGASTTDATKVVTINGGAGNDVIKGGNGKDVLSGGDGNDVITGGAAADNLTGGAGNDIFVLNAFSESVLANRDVITDFSANTFGNDTAGAAGTGADIASQGNFTGDVIDVRGLVTVGASAVDVSVQANAADAQTFIQNQAGGANGIGASLDSSSGLLYMDLVGNDGVIDTVIELTGVSTIDAAAFLVA